jgi:hypothetical protein
MGPVIVEQPNGLLALFDTDDSAFIRVNMTLEEIRERLIERQVGKIDSDIIEFFHLHREENNTPADP